MSREEFIKETKKKLCDKFDYLLAEADAEYISNFLWNETLQKTYFRWHTPALPNKYQNVYSNYHLLSLQNIYHIVTPICENCNISINNCKDFALFYLI